ncbi:MAG TPA: hypothetical protein VJ302_16735 [Blastocatellia bacterium]|nr:hypothetical protein [Blastocatellia bacterium]
MQTETLNQSTPLIPSTSSQLQPAELAAPIEATDSNSPAEIPSVTLQLGPTECEILRFALVRAWPELAENDNPAVVDGAAQMVKVAIQASKHMRATKGYMSPAKN